jgi:succinyl-CoA synthetase beta subunit
MRFYEFEAKRLLGKHAIPVPQSGIAHTAADAERLASEIGCPVVLKAQVLSPAALKAGAVKSADSPAQAKQAAEQLLRLDDGGRKPKGVLVEKRPAATKEYSLAFTYDGIAKLPVMIASDMAGNVDVIADKHPERVVRRHFSALFPHSEYRAKELVSALGVASADLPRMTSIVSRLAEIFLKYDLTQADIPSLARLDDGSFVALDCHMDMEVEGRRRQKAILEELGIQPGDTRAPREQTPFEIEAAKIDAEDPRGVAGPVVEFDGNIGLVIGAGGGSLTTFDAVKKHGGKPANYAALGGNPSVRKAQRLTKLVLSKPGVEKIAVISNVLSNTRADLVARGVIK